MYKKVLVPVSGKTRGKRSHKALAKAREVCDGEIVLLHVTEPIPQVVGGEQRQELENQAKAEGMAALAPFVELLELTTAPFHIRVEEGTVAETIVKVATEEGVDLIVMFTDGRDDLEGLFFGTITERVLRNTELDLLAVRK